MKRDLTIRIGLVVLGVPGLVVGAWAGAAPRSFYDDFPGFTTWVAPDGPYNEHLVRDVGWLNLALALVTFAAAWTLARSLVGAAIGAWLVYGVPHLLYHLNHLDAYDSGDQISMIASLAIAPVVAIALLALARQGRPGGSPGGGPDGGPGGGPGGARIAASDPATRSSSSTT